MPVNLSVKNVPDELAGLLRRPHKPHARLCWRAATLARIASHTATNDIFPTHRAAEASWPHVVETEFTGRKAFSAILAAVPIPRKDIAAIEAKSPARHFIVKQQADHPRYLDREMDRLQPVGLRLLLLKSDLQLADFLPGNEVIIDITS